MNLNSVTQKRVELWVFHKKRGNESERKGKRYTAKDTIKRRIDSSGTRVVNRKPWPPILGQILLKISG